MFDANPQGLEDRQPCNRRKKEMESLSRLVSIGYGALMGTISS